MLQRRADRLWSPNIKPNSQAKETDLWDEQNKRGHSAPCSLCYQAGRERTRELSPTELQLLTAWEYSAIILLSVQCTALWKSRKYFRIRKYHQHFLILALYTPTWIKDISKTITLILDPWLERFAGKIYQFLPLQQKRRAVRTGLGTAVHYPACILPDDTAIQSLNISALWRTVSLNFLWQTLLLSVPVEVTEVKIYFTHCLKVVSQETV